MFNYLLGLRLHQGIIDFAETETSAKEPMLENLLRGLKYHKKRPLVFFFCCVLGAYLQDNMLTSVFRLCIVVYINDLLTRACVLKTCD